MKPTPNGMGAGSRTWPPDSYVTFMNACVIRLAFLRREAQAQETTATQVQMPLNELARTRVENIKRQSFDFGPP